MGRQRRLAPATGQAGGVWSCFESFSSRFSFRVLRLKYQAPDKIRSETGVPKRYRPSGAVSRLLSSPY